MAEETELATGKSIGDLGREAMWFILHTLFAVFFMALVVAAISLLRPDPESSQPKLICTLFVFLIPAIAGMIIARSQKIDTARYVWISGLIMFSVVCVWVLDLPTGPGQCENCGAIAKLWRTFFAFDLSHGSGLMGGDGLLVGLWIPLSMIGYSLGAIFGLKTAE